MLVEIVIDHGNGLRSRYEALYGDDGKLEWVRDAASCGTDNKLVFHLAMRGDGVTVSDTFLGSASISGPMVAVPKAGIIIPYYLFRMMPSEFCVKEDE